MKKILLLVVVMVFALSPLSFANGCEDLVSGQLLQNAQIPLLDQTTSPAADVVRVLFHKKLVLEIGPPVLNNWFYVLAHDETDVVNPGFGQNSTLEVVGTAGWIYYKGSNETSYFRVQKYSGQFTYKCDDGQKINLTASAYLQSPLPVVGGKTLVADVVRVQSSVPGSFYDSNYSVFSSEFVVTTADSSITGGIASDSDYVPAGSMFAKQDGYYYFISSRSRNEIADIYPSMHFTACCSSSQCSSDFESDFKPSSCSSDLFSKNSSCADKNTLVKYSCESEKCAPTRVNCKYGCSNGACKEGTPPKCSSFFEPNIYVRNSVNGVFENKTAFTLTNDCESENKVRVWSCDGSAPSSEVFSCERGCENGVCIQQQIASPAISGTITPSIIPPEGSDNNLVSLAALVLVIVGVAWWVLSRPQTPKKK